jgi:hypothetical protein
VRAVVVLVLALGGCGGPPAPITPPVPENVLDPSSAPAPAGSGSASAKAVDHACIVDGNYNVAVDLKPAKLTQGDTGQGDTEWCASMLAGVASQAMSAMTIRFDAGSLAIDWPPGHPATFDVLGPCELAITVGTQHQGDTCTATNAALSVTRAP